MRERLQEKVVSWSNREKPLVGKERQIESKGRSGEALTAGHERKGIRKAGSQHGAESRKVQNAVRQDRV